MFLKTALKSNQGSDDWLRFFRLCGSLFAAVENNPIDGQLGSMNDIKAEIFILNNKINAIKRLQLYNSSIKVLEGKKKYNEKYFILELDTKHNQLRILSFSNEQFSKASDLYLKLEQERKDEIDIVLVSAESVDILRRAYPNYFSDTSYFVKIYKQALV